MARIKSCIALFIPVIFSILAFLLSLGGVFHCETIKLVPRSAYVPSSELDTEDDDEEGKMENNDSNNNVTLTPELRFGLFNYKRVSFGNDTSSSISSVLDIFTVTNNEGFLDFLMPTECKSYGQDSFDKDAIWIFVRTCATISIMLGFIFMLMIVFTICCPRLFTDESYRHMSIYGVLLSMPIFQSLTFLIYFASLCTKNPFLYDKKPELVPYYQNLCAPDNASYINMASIVLWIITGLSLLCAGRPKPVQYPPILPEQEHPPDDLQLELHRVTYEQQQVDQFHQQNNQNQDPSVYNEQQQQQILQQVQYESQQREIQEQHQILEQIQKQQREQQEQLQAQQEQIRIQQERLQKEQQRKEEQERQQGMQQQVYNPECNPEYKFKK